MTSPLRRRRPTTARATSRWATTAVELAGLAALLLGGPAHAQQGQYYPDSAYSRWKSTAAQANAYQPAAPPSPRARPTPPPPAPPAGPALLTLPAPARQPARQPWAVPIGPALSAPAAGGTIPTAWAPADGQGGMADGVSAVPIQTEPPGIERVFQSLESDEALMERIRQENRERTPMQRATFPPDPVLSTEAYRGRNWNPSRMEVAPYYVAYNRLLFEDLNSERYGWDLGPIQPLVSSLYFLWDFVMLPYHACTAPFRCYEVNLGYCLPGDPVPYMLYPIEWSATGFTAEVATILTLVAIFP